MQCPINTVIKHFFYMEQMETGQSEQELTTGTNDRIRAWQCVEHNRGQNALISSLSTNLINFSMRSVAVLLNEHSILQMLLLLPFVELIWKWNCWRQSFLFWTPLIICSLCKRATLLPTILVFGQVFGSGNVWFFRINWITESVMCVLKKGLRAVWVNLPSISQEL